MLEPLSNQRTVMLLQLWESMGYAPHNALKSLGLSWLRGNADRQSLSVSERGYLCDRVADEYQELLLGLKTGMRMAQRDSGVIGFAALTGETVGSSLEVAARYIHLISEICDLDLVNRGDQTDLVFNIRGNTYVSRHQIEALLAGVACFPFPTCSGAQVFTGAEVNYPAPCKPTKYEEVIGIPVMFGKPEIKLSLRTVVLNEKLHSADLDSHKMHLALAEQKYKKLACSKPNFSTQIKHRIESNLKRGQFTTLEQVCTEFKMSPRKFQETLARQGTSFRQIREEVWRDTSKRLLRSGVDVQTVYQQLGYNDISAFYRAFKRWTGFTPVEYKKQYVTKLSGF